MADAQLSTSITSISERASEVAQTASADELQKISRVAPSLEQSENASLEVAINTRAAAIAGTASAADLKKIGKAIGNMLEPQTTSVSGEFIGSQTNHAGKFFSTNGTSKNWGGVTMGGLQQVQLSTIENDQTLVYNSVSGKFENASRAFDIPEYSLTQNLPASGTTGEVVFDVQSSQLKYWDGSEWKVAAVVATGGGASGGVTWTRGSAFNVQHPEPNTTPSYGGWKTGPGYQMNPRLEAYGNYVALSDYYNQSDNSSNPDARRGRVYVYDMSNSMTVPIRTYKLESVNSWDGQEFGRKIKFWKNPTNDKLYLLILIYGASRMYAYNVTDGSLDPEFQFGGNGTGFNSTHKGTITPDGQYYIFLGGQPRGVYVYDLVNTQTTYKWYVAKNESNLQDLRGAGTVHVDATTGKLFVTDPYANNSSGQVEIYDISNLSTHAPNLLASYYVDSGYSSYYGFTGEYDPSSQYLYLGHDSPGNGGDNNPPVTVYDVSALTATDGGRHALPAPVVSIVNPRVDSGGNAYPKNSHPGFARNSIHILGDKLYIADNSATTNGQEGNGAIHVFNKSDGSHLETIDNPHPELKARWPRDGFVIGEDPDSDTAYLIGTTPVNAGSGGFGFWNAETDSVAMGYVFTKDSASSGSGESSESGESSGSAVTYKIVVGSSKDDDYGNDSGSVYIYDIDGTNEIKINASDAAAGDEFGHSVTVGDNKIVVGAHKRNFTRGAVYVYDMDGTNEIKITTSDQVQSNFGYCVAVGDNKVAVGGYGYNVGGSWRGRAYIYDLDGSNEVILQASDIADDDYFGWSIAVGHNKVAVGALHDDDNGTSSGSVYVYDLDGSNEFKITASDAQADDRFGESVAIGNNKIVVGAPYEDDPGSFSGSVYVYDMDGTNEIKISSSDIEVDDRFGHSVAVGNNKIVVGAPHERGSAFYGGSVYVYDLDGTNEIKIMGSDTADSDQFGHSVAIHDSKIVVGTKYNSTTYVYDLDGSNEVKISVDGRAVAIGQSSSASSGSGESSSSSTPVDWSPLTLIQTAGKSAYDITGGTTGESDLAVDMTETYTVLGVDKAYSGYGSAYIIDTASGNVTATINNPNPLTAGSFGRRNSVGTDGTHVVLGNRDQDEVYVYNMSGQIQRTIHGPDSGAMFGHSVKIDGDYIVVGGFNQDKAYICSTSTGAILHTLTNPNVYGSTPDQFGQVVDISGNFMVVSTVEEDAADGSNSGVAYVYTVDAGSLLHTFVNPNAHGTSALDNFGIDCAIDGNYLVVGAFGESDAAVGSGSGKAYFYNVATGTLLHTIDNPNPDSGTDVDYMGWSVDVEGQTAIVSAWYETGAAGADSGKCYIYDVVSGNLLHTIEDPNVYSGGGTDDRFGSEVAIAGTFIAVSAKGEDHASQDNVGALYVFKGE